MLEIPSCTADSTSMMRRFALCGVLVLTAVASSADSIAGRASMSVFPEVMLWAWERPEDLRSLDSRTGVAFLAQTIIVDGHRVELRPRMQPLRVNPATPLMAVTRIEHPPGAVPPRESAIPELAAHIVRSRDLPRVLGVQIDYDAAASERGFYRALLREVRARIGRSTPLSMTALASWCVGDNWLDGLPVDEIVPMLFSMGPSSDAYRAMAASQRASRSCTDAFGVSLDELLRAVADGRRLYFFNGRPWARETIAAALHSGGLQ